VERAGVSSASNIAVVMVFFLGHSGGNEQDSGRPWWWRRFGYDISQIVTEDQAWSLRWIRVGVCVGFSGRKPRVLTPTVAMPVGVITLLGAPLWVPSRARAPGENPRLGLVDGGV
jgi:hypothetical protein